MAPVISTPEYRLLRGLADYTIKHSSEVNPQVLTKAVEDGFVYSTTYGNLTITREGRERLGELED